MNIQEMIEAVGILMDGDTPTFCWGPPGVGKSDAMRQIAAMRGINLIDFRAPLREAVDMRGLPFVDQKAWKTKWLVPDELPNEKRDGKEGILFLDELNAAPVAVQVACFGLILDRRIGEYTLPKDWRIVAAGNEQKHRAAAQKMPSALANRMAHLSVEASHEAWIEWANDTGINPIMPAFFRFRPKLIHSMEQSDLRAFPSPRSWTQAAKYVDVPNKRVRHSLIAANVGEGAAIELGSFMDAFGELPTIKEIVSDPKGAKVPETPAGKYAVSGAIARAADRSNFQPIIVYAERLGKEFETCTVMDAARRDDTLCQTKAYIKFKSENAHFEL